MTPRLTVRNAIVGVSLILCAVALWSVASALGKAGMLP